MLIACPRCRVALTPRTAAVRPGAPPVTADLCLRCNGLWLDGADEHAQDHPVGSMVLVRIHPDDPYQVEIEEG